VNYEKAAGAPTTRNIAIFATEHDFDTATQLFMRNVAKPMALGEGATPVPIGRRQKFGLKTIFGDQATRSALADLFCGRDDGGSPSLLFSGTHGMSFRPDDPRQFSAQGAIVCQDWPAYGEVNADHWFSSTDVPAEARVHGMMHVFFACHGGGCSAFDNFDRMNNKPRQIAPKPFIAKLPQALLAHPNGGALAVLAHIERAWAYSFMEEKAGSQTQGFRDVMGRLLRGERIGQATDIFNMRWAALSVQLAETQLDLQHGADVSLRSLGRLWVARDDARNFMVLGDPAVRLRVEDLPAGARQG
jgi:Peptidase family C25